jgi:lambda family phage portal protein
MANLVHASGRPISSVEVARAKAQANAGGGDPARSPYDSASRMGPWMQGWAPVIGSADRDWLPGRNTAVARIRDIGRNDPVGASVINRKKNAVVGKGWSLSSRPDARALGISAQAAAELAAVIQSEWQAYANSHDFQVDAERRSSWAQLLRTATGHDTQDGEALGLVEYAADEPTRYKTRLRLVDPDRLSNPNMRPDSATLAGGVERNAAGVPFKYWLRERHPNDLGFGVGSFVWNDFDRFTAHGRPQVLHVFELERAGQTRGVSRFVSALKSFKALSSFTDATLQAATINALIVAFVKSSAGPEAVSEFFSTEDLSKFEKDREDFYNSNPVNLGGGARAPVMPLGDEIQMQSQSKDVTSFDSFVRAILRLIAAALGVTYEEMTMDYSQTNYSSARAAMLHAWAEIQVQFSRLEDQLVRPFFAAWLEEAFDSGYIQVPAGAPDFYDAQAAYCRAFWRGPGRGYIDPTKEILAAAARIEAGVSTLQDECADQGDDWEEIMEQKVREIVKKRELLAKYGLPLDTDLSAANAGAPVEPPSTGVPPEDVRPGDKSALAAIARFAMSADHEAFLDARSAA